MHEALEDIDEEIARFAEELADQGELDNITWIFTADHGMASTKTRLMRGLTMPIRADSGCPQRAPSVGGGFCRTGAA